MVRNLVELRIRHYLCRSTSHVSACPLPHGCRLFVLTCMYGVYGRSVHDTPPPSPFTQSHSHSLPHDAHAVPCMHTHAHTCTAVCHAVTSSSKARRLSHLNPLGRDPIVSFTALLPRTLAHVCYSTQHRNTSITPPCTARTAPRGMPCGYDTVVIRPAREEYVEGVPDIINY